ncbi:hypothetical protein GH714_014108 [Hevea brasiliensis]|uniref:Dof zinc finger protein n=1 Tax=Hevea brasiliensis TaxID=3981 RepID=A0A6A6NH11_HEVBR|nr:hypothetical protein GH714_014108 [Hevea brasiliensis]
MPLESGDRRLARTQNNLGSNPSPQLAEPLTCPRCQSTNTKFCYYNNRKVSQPRHFCKSCRRYWTHGGTLRDVPIGGGTRKKSKRSRSFPSSNSTSCSSTNTSISTLYTVTHEPESLPGLANLDSALPLFKFESSNNLNLNENLLVSENENFISLLNSQQGSGFMGMVDYEPSFGYGLWEVGDGLVVEGVGQWEEADDQQRTKTMLRNLKNACLGLGLGLDSSVEISTAVPDFTLKNDVWVQGFRIHQPAWGTCLFVRF